MKKENTLATKRPDLIKYWDYEKNKEIGLDPDAVSTGSGKKAYWKCENNHSYEREIGKQVKANASCPFCAHKYIKDIPELKVMYDNEKNELSMDKVTVQSVRKVWWKCENGHSFLDAAVYVMNRKKKCQLCDNEFIKDIPELTEMYDVEKNLTPLDGITTGSGKKVWWKCKKGHEFSCAPSNMIRRVHKCHICKHQYIKDIPELVAEFDFEKNTIPLETITTGMDHRIHWKCKKGHEWCTSPHNRVRGKSGCPTCWKKKEREVIAAAKAKKKAEKEEAEYKKQFETPEEKEARRLKEKEEMKEIVLEPDDLTEKRNSKKLTIARLYPKAATMWNYEKNGRRTVDSVLAEPTKNYWWKCENGHEWISVLESVERAEGNGCLCCSKKASKYSI